MIHCANAAGLLAKVELRLLNEIIIPSSPLVSCKNYKISVPLRHDSASIEQNNPCKTIDVFFRVISNRLRDCSNAEYLLYLQGGPGFAASLPTSPLSGWMAKATKNFDIVLMDQRGTGLSTPITTRSLTKEFDEPEQQASHLKLFRADSIVKDCEFIRRALNIPKWGAVLGQSYGGFCLTTYLSNFPDSIKIGLFTGGLPPVRSHPDDVYRATYQSCILRNRRYFERYPHDVELMKRILRILLNNIITLPNGGILTTERFQQIGLHLGVSGGYERIHFLLEKAFSDSDDELSYIFLNDLEKLQDFDTNPIYAILHESIYCEQGIASNWSAERVRHENEYGHLFDPLRALDKNDVAPIYFTGEKKISCIVYLQIKSFYLYVIFNLFSSL